MDTSRLKTTVAEFPIVGVAFRRNNSDRSTHTGIIYRNRVGNLFMVHMAWHHAFLDEPYDQTQGYYSASPRLASDPRADKILADSLADWCGKIGRANNKRDVPYTLEKAGLIDFDTDGNWNPRDPDNGMNCATFALAVFQSVNKPLVQLVTWPVGRPADIAAQTLLVCKFVQRGGADRLQGFKISPQIGKYPRVSPEQVVGACLEYENSRPVDFPAAGANAHEVLRIWDAAHP